MARKLVKNNFAKLSPSISSAGLRLALSLISPTQPPTPRKKLVNMEKNQSSLKLAEMSRKLVKNNFRIFLPPPRKNLVNQKKNQRCPKFAELVCKLVGNIFRICWPPLQIGAKKIKVVPNWLKCRENWSEISFPDFWPPPPRKKIGQPEKKSKLSQFGWTGVQIGWK